MMIVLNSEHMYQLHEAGYASPSASLENRTILRGVSSELAESSSDSVAATLEAEFFRIGSRSRIPRCSLDENVDCDMERFVRVLRFDRGVDGAVLVNVVNDALESEGVNRFEFEWLDAGFLSEERAGGGGSDIGGAEPLLACWGRFARKGFETPLGVSGVSDIRVRAY